jgi:hypothetical protein
MEMAKSTPILFVSREISRNGREWIYTVSEKAADVIDGDGPTDVGTYHKKKGS